MTSQKYLIFDSSSLIALAMNALLPELRELKKIFKGKFLITNEVKKEIVERPLTIKQFELEAMQLSELIDEKILEFPESIGISSKDISVETEKIMKQANSIFIGKGNDIHLIDLGETAAIVLSKMLSDKKLENVLVVDERTTRALIEAPQGLQIFLEKKLHTKINWDKNKQSYFNGFRIIRSTELIYVAYKKGLVRIKNKNVLDALLYALRFKGCAISNEEIEEIKRLG